MKGSDGLDGIIAGRSAISTVGQGMGLNYRGYAIEDLAEKAQFEEVAYLLMYGHLPNQSEYANYIKKLGKLRALPAPLKTVLQLIPKATHPMDVLRTACSFLGTEEPELSFSQQQDIADRLLAILPGVLCYWYRFHHEGVEITGESDEEHVSQHFLALLHGKKCSKLANDTLNASLILYAEHEFNASTFAARVTASTLADFYSAITSAISTLRGPLHGGANEAAMALIEQFSSVDEAETGVKALLAQKAKIMGFGHRVYKTCDPRSNIIKKYAALIAQSEQEKIMLAIAERIEQVMWQEKHLFPNLDFYSACTYHFCQIPTPLFTPIFVLSRVTGWSAHIFEQRQDNRLIRPNSEYTGPGPQEFVPLNAR